MFMKKVTVLNNGQTTERKKAFYTAVVSCTIAKLDEQCEA